MKLKHAIPKKFIDPKPVEYVVPSEIRKVMAVELDLLLEFDCVCKKHNLKYWLIAGTLLGAVRHKGFIPWDDDIDVGMSRRDYEKLSEIAPKVFQHPYFWQTNYTDPGSARGHAQLRNSQTTGILKGEMSGGQCLYGFNQGIFIDIFPFDKIPDDPAIREVYIKNLIRLKEHVDQVRKIKYLAPKMRFRILSQYYWRMKLKWLFLSFKELVLKRDELDYAYRSFESYASQYESLDTKFWAEIAFCPQRPQNYFSRVHDMDELTMLDFEGFQFPAQKNYFERLEYLFGDWHRHVIGGSFHGGVLFDVENPYMTYFKK